MTVKDYQDLFNQASTQLNFLLLAQRNMILIYAFALAFMGFSVTFYHRNMVRILIFSLLIYAIAVGSVSTIDYLDFVKKTRSELVERDFDDGLDLLDQWENWTNFTYALLALNVLIIIIWVSYELDFHRKNHASSVGVAGSSWFSVGDTSSASSTSAKSSKK